MLNEEDEFYSNAVSDYQDEGYSISPQELDTSLPAPSSLPPAATEESIDSDVIKTPTAAENETNRTQEELFPVDQFEVDALGILDRTEDYNTGVNELIDYYKSKKFDEPERAKEVLETYSKDIQYKTKEAGLDLKDTIAAAPIKIEDVPGATPSEIITNWENANLEKIKTSDNPVQIAGRHQLVSAISTYASAARREENDSGTGFLAWIEDASNRAAEGAMSPFAKLGGYENAVKALHEKTSARYDEFFPSRLAGAAGYMLPAGVAAIPTGGIGALAVFAAQGTGESREMYKNSLDATGDTTKAIQASLLTGAASAVQAVPFSRVIGAAVKSEATVAAKAALESATKITAEAAEKGVGQEIAKTLTEGFVTSLEKARLQNFKNVPLHVIEAGTAGSLGRVIGNQAANIGLDQNGDLLHGTWDDFMLNAVLAGTVSGSSALRQNYTIQKFEKSIETINKLNEEAARPAAVKRAGKTVNDVSTADAALSPELAETARTQLRNAEKDAVIEQRLAPELERDENGYIQEKPKEPFTPEQEKEHQEYYERKKAEFINEPPPKDEVLSENLYDATGKSVKIPAYPDEQVQGIPSNVILNANAPRTIPANPAVLWMMRKILGASVKAQKNISNGAFASYDYVNNVTNVLRSLGADPQQLSKSLNHEPIHAIDKLLNGEFTKDALGTTAEKITGVMRNWWKDITADKALEADAKKLAMEWKPGWDGEPGDNSPGASGLDKWRAYRNDPKEIYADVGSAMLGNPEYVRTNYRTLFDAFENGLKRSTELSNFWTQLQKMLNDPAEMSKFTIQLRNESRKKMNEMDIAAEIRHRELNTEQAQFLRNRYEAYEAFWNQYRIAKSIANHATGPVRDIMFDFLNNIKRQDYLRPWYDTWVNDPLRNEVFSPLHQDGIGENDFAHYLGTQHTIYDETNTMRRVKRNPPLYTKAAIWTRDALREIAHTKKFMVEEYFDEAAFSSPEKLNDAFSKINLIADASEIKMEMFLNKAESQDPKAREEALAKHDKRVSTLNLRRESIPMAELREKISKLPKGELKTALEDVTSDGAFNARRYLLNDGGVGLEDAHRDVAYLRDKLGPVLFQKMEKHAEKFHEILNRMLPDMIKSKTLTPDMEERIVGNSATYINTAVLKYYTSARSLDGYQRQAIGSLEETGNEITSSIYKRQASHERSIFQIAKNNAVDMAKESGHWVEQVEIKPGQNLFHLRDILSKSDREHSYIVDYEEGLPRLNKLSGGKSWENMFKNKVIPETQLVVQTTNIFNRMLNTHLFKTAGNLPWAYGQKYKDRAVEALMMDSFLVGALKRFIPFSRAIPIHFFGKKRVFDKATIAELKESQKTGKYVGLAGEFVDTYGAMLGLHHSEYNGLDVQAIDRAVIESMGGKWPENESVIDKIGGVSRKALDAVGGRKLRNMVEFDELRAKINGYRIGLHKGMGQAEAKNWAQENFGNPDSLSGGYNRRAINNFFLFGAAKLNGQRAVGHLVRDMPTVAGVQLVTQVVLPRMWMLPIATTAVGYALGEDAAKKYEKMRRKIPSWHVIGYEVTPWGLEAPNGDEWFWFDPALKSDDINSEWKAIYGTTPQAREITSLTRVIWPMMEGLAGGDMNLALEGIGKGIKAERKGNWQPAIQYMENMFELLTDPEGPTDWFRDKKILTPREQAASPEEKAAAYGKYMLAQTFPGFVPYTLFNEDESRGTIDTIEKEIPLIGPLLRNVVQVSNYGDIEADKNNQKLKIASDRAIEATTSDTVQEMLDEYRKVTGQSAGLKRDEKLDKFGPDRFDEAQRLTTWHTVTYRRVVEDLRSAQSRGDDKEYARLLKELNFSASLLKRELKR